MPHRFRDLSVPKINIPPHTGTVRGSLSEPVRLGEGADPKTGSDYVFHKDVMRDDPVSRLKHMLGKDHISEESAKQLIQRYRAKYPEVDRWFKQTNK